MAGQIKSVKPCLKQLQQSIQTIMATEDGELILFVFLSINFQLIKLILQNML